MWRIFLFSSLSCARRLALCSLKASKSCEMIGKENMLTVYLTIEIIRFTSQYCRFQQTFTSFSYFLVDSSRADWRDFTFTSALTACASRSNLRQSVKRTNKMLLTCFTSQCGGGCRCMVYLSSASARDFFSSFHFLSSCWISPCFSCIFIQT